MNNATIAQEIAARLAEGALPLASHPFLLAVKDGVLTSDQLLRFGLQYHISSSKFARFLCAVASNIPTVEARLPLICNLYDEHGNGRIDRAHIFLFRRLVIALGGDDDRIATAKPFPAIDQYNEEFFDFCRTRPYLQALGAIAAIEYLTPLQYRPILDGCKNHYHLSREALEFFDLHVHEDESHASDITEAVLPLLDSAASREEFWSGMDFCFKAERNFWDALQEGILNGHADSG
jgi:pyrroloquinoline-quinone synthase